MVPCRAIQNLSPQAFLTLTYGILNIHNRAEVRCVNHWCYDNVLIARNAMTFRENQQDIVAFVSLAWSGELFNRSHTPLGVWRIHFFFLLFTLRKYTSLLFLSGFTPFLTCWQIVLSLISVLLAASPEFRKVLINLSESKSNIPIKS